MSATPERVAAGEYAQLGFTIDGGQPPYTFTWSNNAWFSDSSETPFVLTFETKTFTVTVVDHDGVWDFSWIIGTADIDTTSPLAAITVHNETEHGTATLTVVDDQGRTASTTVMRFP